jgi:DNA-binding CsgD family transcriptional regulator
MFDHSAGVWTIMKFLIWPRLARGHAHLARPCGTQRYCGRGLNLATSMGWYWATRATSEGIRWLDELVASGECGGQPDAVAHFMRGFFSILQIDPRAARPALQRAATVAGQAGQVSLQTQSLSLASIAEYLAGDQACGRRLLDAAQVITTDPDDFPATIALLQARALNGLIEGDLGTVESASSEGARISREAGDLYALGMMLMNRGVAALLAGDLDVSKPLCTEALRIAHQIDDRVAQFGLLGALGCHAASSGQPRLAARLLGAVETVRTGAGLSDLTFLAPVLAQAKESVVAAVGLSKFEVEFQAGKRLSRDAASELALGGSTHVAAAARDDVVAGVLGTRQAEVGHLVAEGLSNQQIAARLFISEHTVNSHIRNILNKLGFSSRAQIAAWMATANE